MMSRKHRKTRKKPAEPDMMNVMPSTEMTGGMPALLSPLEQANVFSDVFNLDTEDDEGE